MQGTSSFVCVCLHGLTFINGSIPRLTSKERRHSVIKANCPGKQGEVTLRSFRETMTEIPREAFHPHLDYFKWTEVKRSTLIIMEKN